MFKYNNRQTRAKVCESGEPCRSLEQYALILPSLHVIVGPLRRINAHSPSQRMVSSMAWKKAQRRQTNGESVRKECNSEECPCQVMWRSMPRGREGERGGGRVLRRRKVREEVSE